MLRQILRHRTSRRVSSLALLLQRSPLVKILLPEARVLSTSGFSEAVKWTVTAVAGLGAFDSVSGATTLTQLLPSANSSTVPATGGSNLNFVYQCQVTDGFVPGSFEVTGTLPAGLVQSRLKNSTVDNIAGTPVQSGNFPIKITAWEFSNNTGRFISANFTIAVAAPPAPTFSAHPAGGTFPAGSFVTLNATQTGGYSFIWKQNGTALPAGETILFSRSAPRKFFFPAEDPGTAWRSGDPYDDAAWTSVSGAIGYDLLAGPVNYNPHIAAGGNVQAQMSGPDKPMSAFLRLPFELSSPAAISYLKLRVQSDDGFVAYLNGAEVASQNKPVPNDFTWESNASAEQPDASAVSFREINLTNQISRLRAGPNLLAIQALNDSYESPDFLFNAELAGGIDATNSTRLVLAGLRPQDAGSYTLTATNPAGSATSNAAQINVQAPPQITTHPVSVTINSGATATLNVAATGTAPLSYQWYNGESGNIAAPVSGAVADTFTTSALTATTSFWVRVSNSSGSADSATATVTVRPALENFTHWQPAHFSAAQLSDPAISGAGADPDGDGISNEAEYVFGTLPLTASPNVPPAIQSSPLQIAFTAAAASGTGYLGRTRTYTIETSPTLQSGWTALAGFENITGANQTVTAPLPAGSNARFARLRVRLLP